MALAFAWIIGFSIWFHHFDLPNNHISRWLIWTAIRFDLLDLVDPPVQPGAAPWSWFFLLQRIPFISIAIAVWIAAWGYGSWLLRGLDLKLRDLEQLFFALCLGLSCVSLVMLSLGVCGCLSRWPLMVILLLPCISEVVIRGRFATTLDRISEADRRHRLSRLSWVWLCCLAPFVFGELLGAMSPQVDFDVVEYHLGGPKEWFQQGQIIRLPHNVYTSFPFLSEMLILTGMVLYGDWQWGALAGQAVSAGFIPLTALGLFCAGRRWFSEAAGWLAALVYLTSPWTYRICIIAYAEGGLSCYLFAALYALFLFRDQTFEAGQVAARQLTRFAGLAGLLSGSAMACKYTGLVSVVVPIGIMLIGIAARQTAGIRRHRIFVTTVAFSLSVCAAIGPWLLKNTVETGNPVYPLAVRIFGAVDRDPELDAKWVHAHAAKSYSTWEARLKDLPVRLTDVAAKNDWHSPLMFTLAPLSLLWFGRRRDGSPAAGVRQRSQRGILVITWFYVAWQFVAWFTLTHQIDRFYVPMFSAVAFLSGAGATWWNAWQIEATGIRRLRLWKWGVGILIAASMLYNAELMSHSGITGFNAGRLDLKYADDMATEPRLKWLNDEYESGRLGSQTKVLCVGEAQMFHARYPYLYNTVFNHSLFEEICADPNSPEHKMRPVAEIRAEFQRRGITLIDVNWAEILRYKEPGSYGYTDFVHPDRFKQLQQMGLIGPPLRLPASMALGRLDDGLKKRLEVWAPSLITTFQGEPAFVRAQIFPVLVDGNSN